MGYFSDVLELNDLFCTWGFLHDFHRAVLVDVLFVPCRIDCGSSS
jgi:hypothetical protein